MQTIAVPCTPKTAFVPQVWAPFLPVQNFSLSQAFNLTLSTALWRRKLSWWAWAPPNHLTVSNTHQMLFCTHTHTRSEKTTHQGAEEQAAVPTKSSANPCAVVPTGKHAPPAVCGVCANSQRNCIQREGEFQHSARVISSTGWELSVQHAIQWWMHSLFWNACKSKAKLCQFCP